MKIVFLGTPEFAVATLRAIVDAGYEVVAVVTAPDRPAGRGQKVRYSAVKDYALERGLTVLQPANLKDAGFLAELAAAGADLQVVVAFRMLPEAVWNMPRLGTYNLHASLLPAYRGAAPINWVLINGEQETGVTVFKLKHEIDTGSILLSERMEIGNDTTAGELHDALMTRGARLIVAALGQIAAADAEGAEPDLLPQAAGDYPHAPKLTPALGRIDWSRNAATIHNLVRGLSPHPGAYTYLPHGGSKLHLKILRTSVSGEVSPLPNGSLLTHADGGLSVCTSTGLLRLLEVQAEGKKRMRAEDFARGMRLESGTVLG